MIDLRFPDTDEAAAAWLPLCASEAAVIHHDHFARHEASYGAALAGLIRMGAALPPDELRRLKEIRRAFTLQASQAFEDIDLLLTPVMSRTVPTLAAMASTQPRQWIRRFTTPFSLTGQPTLTFPAGFDTAGLPIAAQLIGKPLGEPVLLRTVHAYQQRTDWHRRRPKAVWT